MAAKHNSKWQQFIRILQLSAPLIWKEQFVRWGDFISLAPSPLFYISVVYMMGTKLFIRSTFGLVRNQYKTLTIFNFYLEK